MILTASFCPLMLSCSPSASSVPKISACPSTSCIAHIHQLYFVFIGWQTALGHDLSAGHDSLNVEMMLVYCAAD